MPERTPVDKEHSKIQEKLDGLVETIELTLISIIQGVALTFLVEGSHEVVAEYRFIFWPYVITGLFIILLFWSRSLIHTLTVIRWPLGLSHNFMYIACALVEAITFTQLANPMHWFALNTLFSIASFVLFTLDLRMIRHRAQDSAGLAGSKLYAIVDREQCMNMKLIIPTTIIFNLVAIAAIQLWPEAMLERGGHVVFALLQMAAAVIYLAYVMRFFLQIAPLIVQTRNEWKDDVLQ